MLKDKPRASTECGGGSSKAAEVRTVPSGESPVFVGPGRNGGDGRQRCAVRLPWLWLLSRPLLLLRQG